MYAALALHDRQTRKSLNTAGTDKVCAVGLVHLPTFMLHIDMGACTLI